MDKEIIKKGMDMTYDMGKFLAPLIQGTLTQALGMAEDKLKYMRWERQVRFIERSNETLRKLGVDEVEKPLPLKYAIPIVQGASLEENDDLQDLWVNLLVNSVANKNIETKRVYMDILERISPLEARIVQKIYTFPFEENRHKSFATNWLPECVHVYEERSKKTPTLENEDIELALMNLARIGCLTPVKSIGGGELFSMVNMTLLGNKFYEACTL